MAAFHAAALYGLWSHAMLPVAPDVKTLFVHFVEPPPDKKPEEPKPAKVPAKTTPPKLPQAQPLTAQAPLVAANDPVAAPPVAHPAPEPVAELPRVPVLASVTVPAEPVHLGEELSVICSDRTAPTYPGQSRRAGESGIVLVQVDLDESGNVSAARVHTSSGYARLDEAALNAVRAWHCAPARRNGQNVKATALQPFKFLIQGK